VIDGGASTMVMVIPSFSLGVRDGTAVPEQGDGGQDCYQQS